MRTIRQKPVDTNGHRHWTSEEIEYIKTWAHRRTMEQLMRTLNRSWDSIEHKCIRLGLTRSPRRDGYTLEDLEIGLDIDRRRIYTLVKLGWLIGSRQGPDSLRWNFKDKDIAVFVRAHPDQVSAEIMKSLWVQDVLLSDTYSHGLGELIDMREMA